MKNHTLLALKGALDQLTAAEMKADKPYHLSGSVRLALVGTLRQVKGRAADIEKVRDDLLRTHGDNGQISAGSAGWLAFLGEWTALLGEPCDLTLKQLTIEDLELDKNQIPLAVLEGLQPLLGQS